MYYYLGPGHARMTTNLTRYAGPQGPKQTFTTSPVKGFTSEVQQLLTQERNLYQKATVKQFTCELGIHTLTSFTTSPRGSLCPDARERAGPVFPCTCGTCGGGGNTGPARSRARRDKGSLPSLLQ